MAKILIVDDEDLIRESIRDALSSGEHEMAEAANGRDAFALIQSWAPDLVLADINMHPVNGYELVEKIRRNPACVTTRIVLITGKHDAETFRLGMNEGADDYLPKPFYVNELLKCVNAQLARQLTYRSAIHNALRRITSVLPHELINPLNGMLAMAHALVQKASAAGNESLKQDANELEIHARKLQRTVENFLLFSQIQAYDQAPGRWSTQGECYYSRQLFDSVARAEALACQRVRDLQLFLTEVPVMVAADLLHKIMREILANAFKFSAPGTPVTVTSSLVGNHCEITVENTGPGMTAHQINSIGAFVRFASGTEEVPGAGLGLYLAKRLTEIHGGTFSVESQPEAFTRVSITLDAKSG